MWIIENVLEFAWTGLLARSILQVIPMLFVCTHLAMVGMSGSQSNLCNARRKYYQIKTTKYYMYIYINTHRYVAFSS